MVKTSSTLRLAALMGAILLAACHSPRVPESGAVLRPLAETQIREILVTHTLTRSGGPFWRPWDYAGVHRSNGTISGRVSWIGGAENAAGAWEVSPEGLYCRTWDNAWGAGQRGCFRVSRSGDTLVFDHVSGSSGDASRYAYSLLPGNPHGL